MSLMYNIIDIVRMLLLIIISGTVSIIKGLLNKFLCILPQRLILRSFEYPHSLPQEFRLFQVLDLDIKHYPPIEYVFSYFQLELLANYSKSIFCNQQYICAKL